MSYPYSTGRVSAARFSWLLSRDAPEIAREIQFNQLKEMTNIDKKPLKIKQYLLDSGDPAASVNIGTLHLSPSMHHTVPSVSKKTDVRWN